MPPETIIENSYKKVIYEDIVGLFEEDDSFLNRKQLITLLEFKCPLYICYDAWMDTDYSYMDMLRDAIMERADDEIKEIKAT